MIGVEDLRQGDRRQEVEAGVGAPGAQEVGAGEVAARGDAASRIVHLHQVGVRLFSFLVFRVLIQLFFSPEILQTRQG